MFSLCVCVDAQCADLSFSKSLMLVSRLRLRTVDAIRSCACWSFIGAGDGEGGW